MKRLVVILLGSLTLLPPLLAQSSPGFGTSGKPTPSAARIVTVDDLRQHLIGKTWSWRHSKADERITFLADGTAYNSAFTSVSRYRILSPSAVELQIRARTARLTFDPSGTHYEGIDFNGTRAIQGDLQDVAAISNPADAAHPGVPAQAPVGNPADRSDARAANYFGSRDPNAPDVPAPPVIQPSVDSTTVKPPPVIPPATAGSTSVKPARAISPASNQPDSEVNMKKTLELLKLARDKLQSSNSTAPKTEPLLIVESAWDALGKTSGDGRYSGHRSNALKTLATARAELQAGDAGNKAIGYVNQTIAEVYTCVGFSR